MPSYKDPEITPGADLFGVDYYLELLTVSLRSLPWIDYSYGRAYPMREEREGNVYTFPAAYNDKGKYVPLDINKNVMAQCWCMLKDPESFIVDDYTVNTNSSKLSAPVDLYVIYRLDLIAGVAGYGYEKRFDERLKADINHILRLANYVRPTAIHQRAENVWAGFDIEHLEWQTFAYPRGGFRFELQVGYEEQCYDEVNEGFTAPFLCDDVVVITANPQVK